MQNDNQSPRDLVFYSFISSSITAPYHVDNSSLVAVHGCWCIQIQYKCVFVI